MRRAQFKRKPGTCVRPIQKRVEMNKLETRYAQHLEALRAAGEILDYQYEPFSLKLAHRCTYTPDFVVVYPDRVEVHETKGRWMDDARVKFKTAAERFWWMRFVGVQWVKKEWALEVYGEAAA